MRSSHKKIKMHQQSKIAPTVFLWNIIIYYKSFLCVSFVFVLFMCPRNL